MAFGNKNKDFEGASWKSFILPVYIVISLIFIVFVVFSYVKGMVYNLGIQNGFNQGTLQTISKLAEQADQCSPIPINYGEKTFQVINVACLQQINSQSDDVMLDEE